MREVDLDVEGGREGGIAIADQTERGWGGFVEEIGDVGWWWLGGSRCVFRMSKVRGGEGGGSLRRWDGRGWLGEGGGEGGRFSNLVSVGGKLSWEVVGGREWMGSN